MTAAILLIAANLIVNPGFEDHGKGWARGIGAKTGNATIAAKISMVASGAGAVQFVGNASTTRWPMLTQQFPIQPGQRIAFRVAGRCRKLRKEANQYANANALLIIQSRTGQRLLFKTSAVMSGDCERTPLRVTAIAPDHAATVTVGVFASMSGTAWFDSPHLAIASTSSDDRDGRRLALEVLRDHLDATYPFFGLNGRPQHAAALSLDVGSKEFAASVRAMLEPLRDAHIWFDYKGLTVPTTQPAATRSNWNLGAIVKRLDPIILQRPNRIAGRIGQVGYVGIGSFVANQFDGIEGALDALADCRALILDVRFNSGGDERLAQRIAARFATREVLYARQEVRDALHATRLVPGGERRIAPAPDRKPDKRPVLVLQGPVCMSSCEGFLLMMRAIENTKTLGLPSRGASANPKPFPLMPDLTVWISTWRSQTPDGQCIEDRGVAPEIHFEAPVKAYAKGDPTLEQALALLSK